MRKFIVILFIILITVGIVLMIKDSKERNNEIIDSNSSSVIEDSTDNFIDPHTIQDPPYNRKIEIPEKQN